MIEMDADGVPSFDPDDDTFRQTFLAHVYDVSVGAYSDASPVTFYVNNVPPISLLAPDDVFLFRKDTAITTIPMSTLWEDSEGDALTFDATGLATGLSEDGTDITGTPTVYGKSDTTLKATDVTGEFTEHAIEVQIGELVPDVDGLTLAAATSAIEAVASMTVSAAGSIGVVTSQDPVAGALAPHDQVVSITIGSEEVSIVTRPVVSASISSGLPPSSQLNGWLQG
jgi:hypothetical protein